MARGITRADTNCKVQNIDRSLRGCYRHKRHSQRLPTYIVSPRSRFMAFNHAYLIAISARAIVTLTLECDF